MTAAGRSPYRVPFVDFPAHYRSMEAEIDAAIKGVLNGGDYILREHLRRFEENLAAYVGVRHAVGVNSGTDAIMLSLRAAGIGPGDEVITVAHTFVATVAAIVHLGGTPVLVDITDDFNMDVDLVEAAITPRTQAIVPVYLNGRLCDMDRLMAIADRHGLMVIEDSAQALGASLNGRRAGAIGLAGCFSFYPAKILGGIGDGGMVTTDSEDVAEKVRLYRDHGQRRATGEILCYGYNSRLDNLQAAVLDVKLRYLDGWIARRRQLASMYDRGLAGIPQVRTPPPPQAGGPYFDVFTNYVIRAQSRDVLVDFLKGQGIEVLVSWPKPMHKQPALGLGHFHLPVTEQISGEVLSLPMNAEVTDAQVDYVLEAIRRFYAVGGHD